MEINPTILPGVFALRSPVKRDARGVFVKTAEAKFLESHSLRWDFRESYVSASRPNVLRGMHFQIPPADGAKLVCCIGGEVHDVLLDLRAGSPGFGKHVGFKLKADKGDMIYMPAGIAHGFWVEKGPAVMLYYQQAAYSPDHDKGIAWDKAGISWPFKAPPVISERDAGFPSLAEFTTPFA